LFFGPRGGVVERASVEVGEAVEHVGVVDYVGPGGER